MDTDLLPSGRMASRVGRGAQAHHLRKLAKRNEIPHVKAGHILLFRLGDLPAIKAACARFGYLEAEQAREVAVNA